VQNDQTSRTALLIAASLVLLHRDPKYSGLVSKASADLCAQMLDAHSAQARSFLKIVRQGWFRPIAKGIERMTIPGILLHYALRKKCIAGLARSALVNGATQVVIIGAGFDPLSFELHQEFPRVHFWEIDHPATQRHKLRTFSNITAEGLHFVAMDLSATTFDREALIKSGFNPSQRTVSIAEGLLMYLTRDVVSSLMRTLESLSARNSQLVFTFMEKQTDGRIRFDSQSKLVDWWLRGRGEPFVWGATRNELVDLVRPWRVVRFFDHDDLRELASGLTAGRIAKREVICLAESESDCL
jgi:methyltransferase (TIGR00027 family)